MTITAAFVVFAVLWFLTLLVILPIGLRTQGEAGEVVPGTPSSAPAEPRMGHIFRRVTLIALVLWAIVCATILWSGIGIRDLDVWGRMDPLPATE
jgi:predicted secreted protein